MKTIFESNTIVGFQKRIENLNNHSQSKWGKMNASQMLKHCCENEKLLLQQKKFKRLFIGRLFGKLALKAMVKDDFPLKKNQPTHPHLKIKENGNIVFQKKEWQQLIAQYLTSDSTIFSNFIHPFFGKMTKEEIGITAYKHIDHHLNQFGV